MIAHRSPLRWRLIRWLLLALAVPAASHGALADAPRLGPFEYPQPSELKVPHGDQTFDPFQALNGSFARPETCHTDDSMLWIEAEGSGECIRTYSNGLKAGANPVVLLYFGGDVMLRTPKGVRFVTPSYARQSPATIDEDMAAWGKEAGVPVIFIARPGIYGSSGDHNQRRHRREMALMNAAVERLKARHAIGSFIVAGHSAGGQVAAALLNWRSDVKAVAISSGLVSVAQVSAFWERRRTIAGRLLYDASQFYDPLTEIDRIAGDPPPEIYFLSDPEDRTVPFFSQLHYVRKLRGAGLEPHHLYLQAPPPSRHVLADYAKRAAAMIARGRGSAEIRRALNDMNVDALEE